MTRARHLLSPHQIPGVEKLRRCAECGASLPEPSRTGRPRSYCSVRCRRAVEFRRRGIGALTARLAHYHQRGVVAPFVARLEAQLAALEPLADGRAKGEGTPDLHDGPSRPSPGTVLAVCTAVGSPLEAPATVKGGRDGRSG